MSYAVKEIFATVQGEGARAGTPAVFVRLAGCNLWNGRPEDRDKGKGACARWCDTQFVGGDKMMAFEIAERASALWTIDTRPLDRWIVLTGGEPLLQADAELVRALHRADFKVALETNGTLAKLRDGAGLHLLDWVCVSPKRDSEWTLRHGNELKVVLPGAPPPDHWTHAELRRMRDETNFNHYFVQPQDPVDPAFVDVSALSRTTTAPALLSQYRQNIARCMGAVAMGWRIGLQTHKLMGLQ